MIQKVFNYNCSNLYNGIKTGDVQKTYNYYAQDLSFKGMSTASAYKTTFDYIASKTLKSNKKWGIDGSLLSASKIKLALEKIFQSNKIYDLSPEAILAKISWRDYIPQNMREYCVNKINSARHVRLREWQNFLENPEAVDVKQEVPRLVNDVKNDQALKFVIWKT